MQHAISLGTAVRPRRNGLGGRGIRCIWETCKRWIIDLSSAGILFECGLPWTRNRVWNSIAIAFSLLFLRKNVKSVFFSVSAVAFSVECSIVTAWRSDPPLVCLFVCLLLLLWKRAGVRKWHHYFILLAKILLPRVVFGIYFTYFRTGIAGQ